MKKIVSILLLCSMLFALIACSSDVQKDNSADTTVASTVDSSKIEVVTNYVEPIS